MHERGVTGGNAVIIDAVAAIKTSILVGVARGGIHNIECVGKYASAQLIKKRVFRHGFKPGIVTNGPAPGEKVGRKDAAEQLCRSLAFKEHRTDVTIGQRSGTKLGEMGPQFANPPGQLLLAGQIADGAAVGGDKILERHPIRRLGGGNRPECDLGGRAHERCALAVNLPGHHVVYTEAHGRAVDLRHLPKERGKLAHHFFHCRRFDLRRRRLVAQGYRLCFGEVRDLFGARPVLQSGALAREVFESAFVGCVGGQPDLAAKLFVIVLQRKRGHARQAREAGRRDEICVVESIVSHAHFNRQKTAV